MKNKRLIIFLSILGFFAFLVILGSTVFALDTVSVNFVSTTNYLTNKEEVVIENSKINLGSSIFFINKEEVSQKIEKENPYVKIVSIETVFPNRLVLHIIEREEVYALKMDDNNYAICDREFKVLKIEDSLINSYVILTGYENIDATATEAGDYVNLEGRKESIIDDAINTLLTWDNNIVNIKANVKEIEFDYERENQIRIEMQSGVNIVVKDADKMAAEKIVLGISLYTSEEADYHSSGVILVIEEQDGTISAVYSPQNV